MYAGQKSYNKIFIFLYVYHKALNDTTICVRGAVDRVHYDTVRSDCPGCSDDVNTLRSPSTLVYGITIDMS